MKVKFYMALPVLLLGLSLLGWAWMITLAVDDPSFAVEENYYEKAAHYDDRQALAAESRQLGWQLDVARFARSEGGVQLRLSLRGPTGRPIDGGRVEIEGLANVRASDVQKIQLLEEQPGVYSGVLPRAWPGLWELRVRAIRGVDHFAEDVRIELSEGSS